MKKTQPVEKNQEYNVTIADLSYQGLGVAKIDNFPIFIENALPGEEIKVQITKVKHSFAFGRVTSFITTSPDRVQLVDKAYTQTGIATLQHLTYSAQLKFKQHQVAVDFQKLGLDDVEVNPTIGMDDPTHYRNKAQVPVRLINGRLETGFYRKHSHDLIPIEDFYIQDQKIDEAILVVRDLLRTFHVAPYNEEHHKGVVRNIMVRRGYYSHEMMIVLVTRAKKIPHTDEIVAGILAKLPEVKSIIQNVNSAKTNALMGPVNNVLAGSNVITDTLLGLKFAISATSFYQINPVQTEKLYQLAIDKADLQKDDVVVDAYCGIGTISLAVAQHVKKVYGVEIVDQAVEDAKHNAKINNIRNVSFVASKAEEQMSKWQSDGLKPDVVFVDPPRKGLDSTLIDSVAAMNPKKVVYVSCNPATLARDVQLFAGKGYHINQPVQPVDQFPQTIHVESVTVLER
ncbi:23S rRNA (uracil(1939)-C(5))-methyltransferase RlmD [Lentilactobacillus kribbianus]|uniref:23S rRNA (uracil(1939)-C(5))-methyltransferase RlmD n=1 Tax=Lentilactobacillus kribbianus TaxID=2729622 RepID=UPI0015560547|nr:23S rRNA (uracil(1939)-C(5))-methyltransferase RlmD [Lentilactobacillus kribbianus]